MQDEIWSEVVLKRLRTVRERTKEGLFGSVPYSFMSSALRARYTVLFCLLWLVATCIQFFECIRVLKVPKKISIYVLHVLVEIGMFVLNVLVEIGMFVFNRSRFNTTYAYTVFFFLVNLALYWL